MKTKKAFITGITGFKGSWLALMLLERGYEVKGLGLEQEDEDSIYHKLKVEEKVSRVYIQDILELDRREDIIEDIVTSDYVYHLAAQPIVSIGYEQPYMTMNVNVMGTMILHEILRKYTKENHKISFMNITTDKVYQPKDRPLKEEDRLNGKDPYSLSKSFSDMISQMYQEGDLKKDNILVSTVRAGNVIGGGDVAPNRIMVDIVKAIKEGGTIDIRSPFSVRPYQHVLDCLGMYLKVSEKQYKNNTQHNFNIGPTSKSIITTIELVESANSYKPFRINVNKNISIGTETGYLALDTSKIFEYLDKKPLFNDVDDIVMATLEWYLAEGQELEDITQEQIRRTLSWWM